MGLSDSVISFALSKVLLMSATAPKFSHFLKCTCCQRQRQSFRNFLNCNTPPCKNTFIQRVNDEEKRSTTV